VKIGIFSDLHSNIYALDRMLEIASDVEKWICLGDFIGLFPPVNEVVSKIRLLEFTAIRGDHEEYLLSDKKMEYSFTGNDSLERQRKQITHENRDYISGLRNTLSITINGIKMRLFHSLLNDGEPGDRKYALDLKDINDKFSNYDIVMYGDTHLPLISYCRDVVVVNPGSCGFPVDKIRQPSYAILDTSDLSCEIRRFDYDKKQLLNDIMTHGYNQKLYDFIENGYWGK